ncbi:MAG TPA: DUF6152 family protein [Vicinamibacterales bacterium]|jgi:hypothetical protein|nr:DUF6152 family protein [Vicinamibacterales bacterium]
MARRSFLCVAAATLLSATPALAHHAFSADFDINKPITLDGTLTKIEWTNPHPYLYLDTTDKAGKTTNWKIELGGNADLDRYGWMTTLLKVGQEVTMRGWQAKNGSTFANADTVTIAGGVRLWAASSYHPEFGRRGTLARNSREPGAVATRGVDGDDVLPETGSPLSFVGLLGSLSFLVALALNRANR